MNTGPFRTLFGILGSRTAVSFGLAIALLVGLLAAVQITSRYALKRYGEDQINRIKWDFNVYQQNEAGRSEDMRAAIAKVPLVRNVEDIYFLRTQFLGTVVESTTTTFLDGELMQAPWVSLLSATKPDLLPPEVRPQTLDGAVLVMIGSKVQLGDAYLAVQNAKKFELRVRQGDIYSPVFATHIERVVRMDRAELSAWFMDQTSSPIFVPEYGLVLVTPFNHKLIADFDDVSRGIKPHAPGEPVEHISPGEYFQEVIHLAAIDRAAVVAPWDMELTHERVGGLSRSIKAAAESNPGGFLIGSPVGVDNTIGALSGRMAQTSRAVGVLSLLVALPLLWMAWVLLANLSSLLLLNERRKFGLLRLRGAPGRLLGRITLTAIAVGGVIGGLLAGVLGTLVPLRLYAGEWLPLATVLKIQNPLLVIGFVVIAVALALLVSRRLVAYVSNISPLEASGRVAVSEAEHAGIRFGVLQGLALLIGGAKVVGWVTGYSVAGPHSSLWLQNVDRGLDFVAFPLFVYGVVALVVSRSTWLAACMRPSVRLLGGSLASLSLKHIATRPHRVAGLLLIVALMASLSLYPTVMTAVFDNKLERAALVQLGAPLQVTLNVADLVEGGDLVKAQGLKARYEMMHTKLGPVLKKLGALREVASVGFITEGLVEGLYMPGYGLGGVPIYLVDDPQQYLKNFYHEEALGETSAFSQAILSLTQKDRVLLSAPLWRYWQREVGSPMPVGRDVHKEMVSAPVGGSVRFMPGIPVASVADRDSFVGSRVDYLNRMFNDRAYEVAAASNPRLAQLDVLLPRVMVVIRPARGVSDQQLRSAVLGALPVVPLQVRDLDTEMARLGSDMYIFLARENVRIYLLGGIVMALIGIIAVALANYAEDRRTLGLLRIRGGGPRDVWHFLTANLVSPSLVGLVLGMLIALLVGYGITNVLWKLRDLETIMRHLPTHLAVSGQTVAVAAILIGIVVGITLFFSRWVFRRTAREGLV